MTHLKWKRPNNRRTVPPKNDFHGAVIVYDTNNENSFDNIKLWLQELDHYAPDNINKVIAGNKCDLIDKRKVEFGRAKVCLMFIYLLIYLFDI